MPSSRFRASQTVPGIRRLRLLRRQGDVQALHVEREADGGQRTPELPQQIVVTPATAHRYAVGGVIDLKYRAGVVVEAAHEPEVVDDPPGHGGLEQGVQAVHPGQWLGGQVGEAIEHLGAARGSAAR